MIDFLRNLRKNADEGGETDPLQNATDPPSSGVPDPGMIPGDPPPQDTGAMLQEPAAIQASQEAGRSAPTEEQTGHRAPASDPPPLAHYASAAQIPQSLSATLAHLTEEKDRVEREEQELETQMRGWEQKRQTLFEEKEKLEAGQQIIDVKKEELEVLEKFQEMEEKRKELETARARLEQDAVTIVKTIEQLESEKKNLEVRMGQ